MPEEADPLDLVIGENVARIRNEKKMSRDELARRVAEIIGTPFRQQAVFRIERGLRPLRLTEASAVATVLGAPLAALTAQSDKDIERYAKRQEFGEAYAELSVQLRRLAGAVEQYERAAGDFRALAAEVRHLDSDGDLLQPDAWELIDRTLQMCDDIAALHGAIRFVDETDVDA